MTNMGKPDVPQSAETASPGEGWFDVEAMKRRFGTPPLFGRDNMADFDEFMRRLASCMDVGDSIVALYIYQYGLEEYKKIMLLNWQSQALAKLRVMSDWQNAAEADAVKLRHRAHEPKAIHQEIIAPANNSSIEYTFLLESIHNQVMNGLKNNRAAVEIRIAADVERGLQNYRRIDRLINECSKRAKGAMARVYAHSRRLAERLLEEGMQNAIEKQQDEQLSRFGVPEGLKDVW
jgi:hypothetical protein